MSNREFHITDAASGTAIAVRIVPLARCDEIAGIEEDGTVKIRLMAAPVEGEMNEALSGFLAGCSVSALRTSRSSPGWTAARSWSC